MKASIIAALVMFGITGCSAKINNAKTATVKISGNCGICKSTIEEAGNVKGIANVNWNKDTKEASIIYDAGKTNPSEILRRVSTAGYDNEMYLAPDEAYGKLKECCMYDRDKKIKMVVAAVPVQKDTVPSTQPDTKQNTSAATQQEDQFKTVFENYFAVKNALVKSDVATASSKAAALLTALNAVKMEALAMDVHMVWMKVEKDLKMHAQHIGESKEMEHQRDHFSMLSTGMYQLIKAAKPSETVYLQHCPMYNDGKGADWLSKEDAIKNPYYGSAMLTCGKTVETIKQ